MSENEMPVFPEKERHSLEIYLDNAATTQVCPEAAEAALTELSQQLQTARENLEIVETSSDLAGQTAQYRETVQHLEEDYYIAALRAALVGAR